MSPANQVRTLYLFTLIIKMYCKLTITASFTERKKRLCKLGIYEQDRLTLHDLIKGI